MRYPLAPLRHAAEEPNNSALARRLGITYRSVIRHQADGMSLWRADALAVSLGFHPCEVWAYWYDEGEVVA